MRLESIRSHLAPYSIVGKRRTTIAHAFASAIAPGEPFDPQRVREALVVLGQTGDDIRCVYCGVPAETWDHLVGLVLRQRFSGHGHQIGNLVPCCKACNSSKGSKAWRTFWQTNPRRGPLATPVEAIAEYQTRYGGGAVSYELLQAEAPEDIRDYERIEREVLSLMREADQIAQRIRTRFGSS